MADEKKAEVEKPDTTKILEIFNQGMEKEAPEDDIKMKMIGAKSVANFKNVTRFFNQFMIDTGRAITREAKATIVSENCDGADLADEKGFNEAVKAIAKAATGVTDNSAASLVRAWAKKAEVECFAKPKGTGAVRNPFVTNFHDALVANPKMDEAGLKAVIEALEPQNRVNPQRWFNQHNAIRKMVNKIAEGKKDA